MEEFDFEVSGGALEVSGGAYSNYMYGGTMNVTGGTIGTLVAGPYTGTLSHSVVNISGGTISSLNMLTNKNTAVDEVEINISGGYFTSNLVINVGTSTMTENTCTVGSIDRNGRDGSVTLRNVTADTVLTLQIEKVPAAISADGTYNCA